MEELSAVIDSVDSATEETAQVKNIEFIWEMIINMIDQARKDFESKNDIKFYSFIVS